MSKSKSSLKCFIYKKIDHFVKDCPRREENEEFVEIVVASDMDSSYASVGALVMSSLDTEKSWVIDLECSYHMCTKKQYFENLKLKECEVVLFVIIRLASYTLLVQSNFKYSMIVNSFYPM